MQYEASTPEEYRQLLEDDWRRSKLESLRTLIFQNGPQLEECIQYKMLGYRLGQTMVFQLNAQKGYVSLYIGDIRKVDPDGTILQGVNQGKGCIRFSKSVALEKTGVDEFIRKTIALAQAGVNIGCH